MGKFIEFCLKHKLIIYLLTFFILFAGTASVFTFKRELMPERNYPWISVTVSGTPIPAEEIENKVTDPVEKEIKSIADVKNYRSTTTAGAASFNIEAEDGKGAKVKQDVEAAVNRLRSSFPKSIKDVIVTQEGNQATEILMGVALSGKDVPVLYNLAKTKFKSEFEAVDGVKKVEVSDTNIANKIQITFRPDQLQAYNIAPGDVAGQLQAMNLKQAIGTLKNPSFNTVVEIDNSLKTVEQMNGLLIKTSLGDVPLSNLAAVEDLRGKKKDAINRYNGQEYVDLFLTKTTGSDIIGTSDKVKEVIDRINKEANGQYRMTVYVDFASFIKPAISNLSRDLVIGGVLAIIILFVFLRNWRVTLVISTTLPLSIMMTFIGMKFGGYNIDLVTLISLSLSTGLIVDAAIVVLESIYHFREKGKELQESIKLGVKEVLTPVLTSQLTLIVVFIPLVVSGIGGAGFKPIMITLAFTITAAIVASTISALLFVPVFSNGFLKNDRKAQSEGEQTRSRLTRFFTGLASLALRRRLVTVALAALLLAGAFLLTPFVKNESVGDVDENHVSAGVVLQKGETVESALPKALQIEKSFKPIPEIKDLYVRTNESAIDLDINLVSMEERKRPKEQILLDVSNKLNAVKGIDRAHVNFGNSGQTQPGVELEVKGKDTEKIRQLSDKAVEMLAAIPGVKNAHSDFSAGEEKLILTPKQDVMNQFGITQQSLMSQIGGLINEQAVTKFTVEDLDLDVVARYPENLMKHPEQLRQVTIATPNGLNIPLAELVDWKYSKALKSIAHKDGGRISNVSAEIIGSDAGTVSREVAKKLALMSLPEGYSIQMAGTLKQQGENAQSALLAFLAVIGMIYLIMVAQFNRLSHPFIILLSLPMAVVGVVIGLVVTQRPLMELGYVGIIMLVGIVVSNAILLIDRINLLRTRDKMELEPAILEAVRNRVRPILMTKLTAILGMLPLALAMAEGSSLEAPIATIVIFGLIFHTLITLVLVPVLYSLFEGLRAQLEKLRSRRKRRRNKVDEIQEVNHAS